MMAPQETTALKLIDLLKQKRVLAKEDIITILDLDSDYIHDMVRTINDKNRISPDEYPKISKISRKGRGGFVLYYIDGDRDYAHEVIKNDYSRLSGNRNILHPIFGIDLKHQYNAYKIQVRK